MTDQTLDRRDPSHLGDGVYVAHDGYQLWVRANDHYFDRPMLEGGVALEPGVITALIKYAKRHGYT
jgi:hypothetical protein